MGNGLLFIKPVPGVNIQPSDIGFFGSIKEFVYPDMDVVGIQLEVFCIYFFHDLNFLLPFLGADHGISSDSIIK